MSHTRPFPSRLLTALLALGVSVTACDAPPSDRTIATAPPSSREPMIDDPRIGEGLPTSVRFVGVEHNRLTLVMLRQTRDPAQRALARRSPCETVVAGLVAESQRTAAAASIPQRAHQLAAIVRGVMASHPTCSGRIAHPSMSAILGDVGATAEVHPDSVLTNASYVVIDQMIQRIRTAASVADVQAALTDATVAASALHGIDALAVQAAVAQSQGSMVLWGPGGSGWSELGLPIPAQSIFREDASQYDGMAALAGILGADAAGCQEAMGFMRALPIVQDSRLLLAACGAGAAAGTVYYGYRLFNEE